MKTSRKNRIGLKRSLLGFALAGAVGLGLLPELQEARADQSGLSIMEKVAETRKLAGSEAVIKMSIISSSGQKRERKLTMATKLFDGGKTEKRVYVFMDPPDVKGTGVLVFDYESKADDVWVHLPALRKTRRIVSSERSKSFMGSEFTYGDLNIPPLGDYTYKKVKEESFGGEQCWVIDVVPKSSSIAESEGYSKKTYWISKSKFAVRRGLFYDLDKELLKELKADDIKLLDPAKKRFRAMRMEMVNKQNGRRSVFQSEKVTFAPNTGDGKFQPGKLEQL